MIIDVPDVDAPEGVCWKQQTDPAKPFMFSRCTFKKGHDTGAHPTPHQWVSCLCPDDQIQMTPSYGPLAPGGPQGQFWTCPTCGLSRMWPD